MKNVGSAGGRMGIDNSAPEICSRTFNFAVRIVKLCRALDRSPGVSRTLSRQLLRSGTSVGANVEEAQAAISRKEFIQRILISLKEIRESSYWLRLIVASNVLSESDVPALLDEAKQIGRVLGKIAATARLNEKATKSNK